MEMRISIPNLRKSFKHAMLEEAGDKTGNVRINLTQRRARAAIDSVEKQQVLHILRVCL